MFEWIKNYLLQQEINAISLKKQFVEWDKMQKGVVLVSGDQYATANEFVKQSGKNFDVVVIHPDKTSETKDCFLSVNKKNFNFFGLPNQETLQKLKSQTYDILINMDFNKNPLAKVVTGLTIAKCKMGPESAVYSEFFDISIQSDQADFLKQAHKYLMMIKS